MNCVAVSSSKKNHCILEKKSCRPKGDSDENNHENGRYELELNMEKDEHCTTPRNILINSLLKFKIGTKLSIKGALSACPKTGPDSHHCLCMQNIQEADMKVLEIFFRRDETHDFRRKKLTGRDTSF